MVPEMKVRVTRIWFLVLVVCFQGPTGLYSQGAIRKWQFYPIYVDSPEGLKNHFEEGLLQIAQGSQPYYASIAALYLDDLNVPEAEPFLIKNLAVFPPGPRLSEFSPSMERLLSREPVILKKIVQAMHPDTPFYNGKAIVFMEEMIRNCCFRDLSGPDRPDILDLSDEIVTECDALVNDFFSASGLNRDEINWETSLNAIEKWVDNFLEK